MKELTNRGSVEEAAVIRYVVDGIYNNVNSKMVLYKTKDLQDLKEKLRVYEKVKEKRCGARPKQSQGYTPYKTPEAKASGKIRCYNCGSLGHKSDTCPSKASGIKCFKCNEYGHRSFDCASKKRINVRSNEDQTSSQRIHVVESLPYSKNLSKEKRFGNGKVKTLGSINCILTTDNEEFTTTMHVVPEDITHIDIIIGRELLSIVYLTINGSSISISKQEPRSSFDIMAINTVTETGLDIGATAANQQRHAVEDLVASYRPEKTKVANVEMKLVTMMTYIHSPRRLPFVEREIVDKEVSEWIKEGIVETCASEYSSQVVVVKKEDGTLRICIDYRKINKKIVKDRYPLPLIEDQIGQLQDARVFSTLDFRNGFFHVNVEENSKKYTSLVTHSGQYRFNKVPFGLCNSPSVFQHFFNKAFRSLTIEGCRAILLQKSDEDDLLHSLFYMSNRKRRKQEGFLNPLPKDVVHAYHVDRLGPRETTNKRYKHILGVIDGFTKFNTFGNHGPSEFMTKRMTYDPGGSTPQDGRIVGIGYVPATAVLMYTGCVTTVEHDVCPPVAEMQDFYWRDYTHGDIPYDAIEGGVGKYIGQAYIQGHGIVPAAIYPHRNSAIAIFNTRQNIKEHIKILCAADHNKFYWKRVNFANDTDKPMKDAVKGGFQDGYNLFIGMAYSEGQYKIGKKLTVNMLFSDSTGRRWFRQFKEDLFDVEDAKCECRPRKFEDEQLQA
ncbi:hypothetical protein Trydic_g1648 [Trypoxylus dichotomus]